MLYEIHTASKDHSKDEVLAGAAASFPEFTVESIKDGGDEWLVRLFKGADGKPPFLDDSGAGDDAPPPEDSGDGADDKDDDGGDVDAPDDDKGDGPPKDKGDKSDDKSNVVDELKDLMHQLQDVIKQVGDKAGDAIDHAQDSQDKLDKAKDALGDDAPAGLDDLPGGPGGDTPAPPLPSGAKPPMGGPKPPVPPKSVVPGRPGVPAGGGPGIPTFTNVEVASHPGVDDKGERISLLAAAQSLESDPEFADYEVIGMIENADGSYSAKLKKKQ